MRSRKIE